MALDDILSAIREEARAEAAALRREGKQRARAIEEDARARAGALAERIAQRAERHADDAKRELQRDAERKRRATRLAVERERVDGLFAELEARLGHSRDDPERHLATTTKLVAEALAALPDATVLRLDPRDRSIVEPMVDATTVALQPTLTTWGGVVLCAGDGRRRVDNTLEARLRARREDLLLLIADATEDEGGNNP